MTLHPAMPRRRGLGLAVLFAVLLAAQAAEPTPRRRRQLPRGGVSKSFGTRDALKVCDFVGTASFAVSGAVAAGHAGMDVLGSTVVGVITALGGGTIREMIMGQTPAFWMRQTEYLYTALGSAVLAFFFFKQLNIPDEGLLMKVTDALGVGAFTVIGTQVAAAGGYKPVVVGLMALITACFGGLTRDVLCQKPGRILYSHAELYGTCALAGSAAYMGLTQARASEDAKIIAGLVTTVVLRALAWENDIKLPTY